MFNTIAVASLLLRKDMTYLALQAILKYRDYKSLSILFFPEQNFQKCEKPKISVIHLKLPR